MKEQAARVINTYQTFNCTISEQYVPLCVCEHWQLEMHRQMMISTLTALSTPVSHSHSRGKDTHPNEISLTES